MDFQARTRKNFLIDLMWRNLLGYHSLRVSTPYGGNWNMLVGSGPKRGFLVVLINAPFVPWTGTYLTAGMFPQYYLEDPT